MAANFHHVLDQLDRLVFAPFSLEALAKLRGNGKLIKVISARTMHRKERLRHEQEV